MRLKLIFQLENNTLDIQYRKSIISWIKYSLQTYDEKLFENVYNANSKKSFCFATILPKPAFSKEEVTLENSQFSVVFSIYNYVLGLHLYNSFLEQKFKKFSLNKNSMTLNSIIVIPEKEIKGDKISIKMSSPMIVRCHSRETLKDMYYAYDRDEFQKYIKINIEEQLVAEKLDISLLDNFKIIPIEAKKAVIPVYEKMIETSLGTFELNGKPELLDYLYKAGIGAKKAMGFRFV